MIPDPGATVIVGVAQRSRKPDDPARSLAPVALMTETVDDALDDAGIVKPGAGRTTRYRFATVILSRSEGAMADADVALIRR